LPQVLQSLKLDLDPPAVLGSSGGSLTFQCFSMQKRYVPTGSSMPWIEKKRVDGHIRVLDAEKSSFFDATSKHVPSILMVESLIF